MEDFYGFPVKGRRSYGYNPNQLLNLNPNSNPNPNGNSNYNQLLDPFHHPNIYGINYPKPYYFNSNSQPRQYRDPHRNPNSQPNQYRDPYQNPNSQPTQYRDLYQNLNSHTTQYHDPYQKSNPQRNQYWDPYQNPNAATQPAPNPALKPKVVNIPIQDVSSELGASRVQTYHPVPAVAAQSLTELAAVKIQKVVRGFLVRKNWSVLRKIEAEAEAIGEEIARDEAVLEKDAKARIRVGESLMGLLFRLDSVRGVRDYRKKVIRKVISLQELVDLIGARGNKNESKTIEVERSDLEVDTVSASAELNSETVPTEENKMVESVDSMEESPVDLTFVSELIESSEQTPSSAVEDFVMVDAVESPVDSTIKSVETTEKEKLGEEFDVVCDPTETIELEATVERSNAVDQASGSSPQAVTGSNESNETGMKGMRHVMERVVAESERMKHLMEELCQSSARQWSLMEGIVDRVQRLEKEVAKMEKKGAKKKKGNGKKSDGSCKKSDDL